MKSFDNYLVAVESNNEFQFNFRFKLGDISDLQSDKPLEETKIQPEGAEVKRAVIWYGSDNRVLLYMELFDKDGHKLLEAGAI